MKNERVKNTEHGQDVEKDADFEELNQLSLFYAEHDNVEKDPDFAPKPGKKAGKRPIKKPVKYKSEVTFLF